MPDEDLTFNVDDEDAGEDPAEEETEADTEEDSGSDDDSEGAEAESDDDGDDDSGDEEDDEGDIDLSEIRKEFKDLKGRYESATQHIDNLNKAVSGLRKENKALKGSEKKGDDASEFTDAQLLQLMQEHNDDPGTLFQIIKQVAKQTSAKSEKKAIDSAEVSQVKKEYNQFLSQWWPDWKDEGSSTRTTIDNAVEQLRVGDHPYSDFLAMGAMTLMQYPDLLKQAKEQGRKEALKEKGEATRKAGIKNKSLASGKGQKTKQSAKMPEGFEETAKLLGMNKRQKEQYKKMLANKNQAMMSDMAE